MEKREDLACVHVSLESGRRVLQTGKLQRLRHAKRVLVGMTAHTVRSRPIERLLALFVASIGPMNRNEERVANQSNHARIGLQMHLAFV